MEHVRNPEYLDGSPELRGGQHATLRVYLRAGVHNHGMCMGAQSDLEGFKSANPFGEYACIKEHLKW